MRLRAKEIPIEVIALILGHEDIATTYAFYLHADMRAAEQAIASVAPPKTKPGRYRAPDPLLAFLELSVVNSRLWDIAPGRHVRDASATT